MLGAIKYALANLARPQGRDARQTFWYWVLALVVLRFGLSMAQSIPLMAKIMSMAMASVKSGHAYDPATEQARIMGVMIEQIPRIARIQMAVDSVTILLLLSSVARRLHDIGWSGWFALVPAGCYATGLAMMPAQIARSVEILRNMDPRMPPTTMMMMQGQGPLQLLTWGALAMIIGIGAMASQPGPNRYGDAPVRF